MIVCATELANDSKTVLDRVACGGETVEVQRHGKTVTEIQRKAGASRDELLRLLRGRGFTETDSRELKRVMDAASEIFGYAGREAAMNAAAPPYLRIVLAASKGQTPLLINAGHQCSK